MKALILKDFYVLRRQLRLYALIIVAFQALGNVTSGFITVLYASLLPVTAFAYDDQSKWDAMELMLPYSVRQIVLSRYCVGWISAASFMAFAGAAQSALSLAPWRPLTENAPFDALSVTLAEFAFALIFLALTMPVYFRYDAEQSRLIRTLMLVLVCGAVGGGIALLGVKDAPRPVEIRRYVGVLYALAALLTPLSIALSMAAWKRRHR